MTLKRIAYFISPHGFGHAARSAAVMETLSESDPAVRFEIFTSVPSWFFEDSVSTPFTYHRVVTDIGLVQKNAFEADLEDSLRALNDYFPLQPSLIEPLTATIRALKCDLIVCDIAPLGILIAKKAQIPSILVENFTWDWIYQQYIVSNEPIKRHIDYLQPIFNAVDYHIQTEPICCHHSADLTTAPVSRKSKSTDVEIRQRLGLPANVKMVLITTGGIPQCYDFFEELGKFRQIIFVMPGAGPVMKRIENLIVLPHRSDFFHPDLVNAADAVIGKVGYSTLSEVYHGGVPFGYVARSNYRESESMVAFIEKQMPAIAVNESEFSDGKWTAKLADLLDIAPVRHDMTNGAVQISRFIEELLS